MIPLSLYIHFPWCIKKCPYCDFNSHKKDSYFDEATYTQCLIKDFTEDYARLGQNRKIHSIFMGGGTPSLFSAEALAPLFQRIEPYYSDNIEITLEANPGTIEHGAFKQYFDLGINRISLGVQSLNPRHLKALGRIHSVDDVARSIDEIKNAGFKNFNLDLMHGLPSQTLDEALDDLAKALQFTPTHLSWYQLTIEPNTYFANYPPQLPIDETLADIEDAGFELLNAHGFRRYEISAFARDNKRCQHNLNYWEFGDYIGIGAGAHGKITDRPNQKIIRTTKHKLPKNYLDPDKDFLSEHTEIEQKEQTLEFMLNALRLIDGFDLELISKRTFVDIETLAPLFAEAQDRGLIHLSNTHLQPTAHGLRFLNDLTMVVGGSA
jgi:oxygen-independent coproporphyrinogen-3 oxidase